MRFKITTTSVELDNLNRMKANESFVKIFFIFTIFVYGSVSCERFIGDQTALSASQSPLFCVSKLIRDWNEKHKKSSEILIFNIGKKNEFSENIMQVVPGGNAVQIVSPSQCKFIENRDDAFIIILSDEFDYVSERL